MPVSLDNDPDAELVRQIQDELPFAGKPFERLVQRHQQRVYNSCRRYLRDDIEAEDASQEVFLKVFQSVETFDGRSPFGGWLYRIVHNHCINRLQRDKSWRMQWKDAEELDSSNELISAPINDDIDIVQKALERMPGSDRQLLILRFEAELTINELAESLDLNLSAAKMRLYRAIDRFKLVYEQLEPPMAEAFTDTDTATDE